MNCFKRLNEDGNMPPNGGVEFHYSEFEIFNVTDIQTLTSAN